MKEFKGTPGPWHVGTRSGHNANMVYSYDHQEEYGDSAIASAYMVPCNRRVDEVGNGEGVANIHLIAAAPELLEALRQATTSMLNSGYNPNSVVIQANNAAIAKALGETE